MIIILGLADLMAGAVLLAQFFGLNVPASMVLFFAAYLIFKGGIFILLGPNLVSVMDVVSGIILIAFAFFSVAVPALVLLIFAVFLIQKGVFALFV